MAKSNVLIYIVEDDPWYKEILSYHLSLNPDNEIVTFESGKECLKNLHKKPDIITLDFQLPDLKGNEILKKIKTIDPEIEVIMISGQEDINTAVSLLREGAYEYIVKDDNAKDRLWNTVNHIRNNRNLRQENESLREEVRQKYNFESSIIGNSTAIKNIYGVIEKASNLNITVSISGETGTGKELVAKAIHYNSNRAKKPFVPVNVAAIPAELLESELFGHEKGAFTGAVTTRVGKFEEAHQGTIFLDEIAELDLSLQAKLLRVLQEREITKIGSNQTKAIDVRIIVATHRNLAEEVGLGHFREDLYFRLLGLPIQIPPLRHRDGDILILAKHFVEEFCKMNNIPNRGFSEKAREKLLTYSFPGNIRELKAIVELATALSEGLTIDDEDITFSSNSKMKDVLSQEKTLKEHTIDILQHYLNKYNGDVLFVADKLDIGKSTIYKMIKNKEIEHQKNSHRYIGH